MTSANLVIKIMSVIFILIACSLLLAGSFLGAYLWAAKSGQFEDDYTPSIRILFDEGLQPFETTEKKLEAKVKTYSNDSETRINKPNDPCQKTTKKK